MINETNEEEELTIDERFELLVREEMTEDEFWSWVRDWYDVDTLMDQILDWDEETKRQTLEEYENK